MDTVRQTGRVTKFVLSERMIKNAHLYNKVRVLTAPRQPRPWGERFILLGLVAICIAFWVVVIRALT